MSLYDLIGYCAACLTTISLLPQIIKIIKEKETTNISLTMYIFFSIGVILWLIFGILIGSLPIIIANSITLFFSMIILFYKIKFK